MRSLLFALSLAGTAHAACGIDACPRPQLDTGRIPLTQISAGMRTLNLSTAGQTASAYESIVAGSYAINPALAVGARVPFITLQSADSTRVGLGNLVLNGEWRAVGDTVTWRAGLQLETPTGADGLVDQHFELLPYGVAQIDDGRWRAQAWVGYRRALVGGHDHGAHDHGESEPDAPQDAVALYAAGHAEQEALARLLVGGTFFDHRVQPAAGVGVQQVIGHDATTFAVARAQLRSQLNETFAVSADTEIPISDARRFDWVAGLRFDCLL